MKKIVLFLILITALAFSGCSRATPRAGAGIGVGVGLDFSRKIPIKPYVTGGIGAGFRFF